MEEAECGAASLAMVLASYGRYVPLEQLRTECGVSRDGANAAGLLRAARAYGLDAHGYRKDVGELHDQHLPAIVFWNANHFVVVERFRGDQVHLNDPAVGHRVVTDREFREAYSGIVLTFEPGPEFRAGGARSSFARSLGGVVRGSRSGLVAAVLAGIGLAVPTVLVAMFAQLFVDEVLVANNDHWVVPLLGGMAFTLVVLAALTYLQQYVLVRLQVDLALRSSSRFLWHLLRLPTEFFAQRFVGGLVTRLQMNDDIATLLSGQLATAFIGLVTLVVFVVVMLFYSLVLTAVGVGIAVLNLVVLRLVARRRIDANNLLQHEQVRLDGAAFGGINIIESLKAEGAESDYFARWAGFQTHAVNAGQSVGRLTATLTVSPATLSAFNSVVVLVVGAVLVIDGSLSIGALVAFTTLMASFLLPISNLVTLATQLQTARGDMAQIEDVLNYEPDRRLTMTEQARPRTDEPLRKLEGFVELDDVTFGYTPHAPPLVQGLSVTLRPGSRVALIGATGSGKSTVGRLVTGLYAPWSGSVRFDGRERTEIAHEVMTNSLAAVDQDIYLFEGTVMENLTLWDPTVDEEAVMRAIDDACIREVIMQRPGGLHAPVAENGRDYSGGERQRLEIARALALDPSILVLDEATSALDAGTELTIDRNIRRRGCTCLIIAHRLSTIRDSDEIIVLDRGSVVERGTHDELMALRGRYAELVGRG
jgi:NHLM bacteriocin system ABC transporter peptidase/ATP-binding protein